MIHPKVKVVTAEEMSRIESASIAKGAEEKKFMENAGRVLSDQARRFIAERKLKPKILLLTGKGKNGGDAYVAGQHFLKGSFSVSALSLAPIEESPQLVRHEMDRFVELGGRIHFIKKVDDIDLDGSHLLIDGLFGTGFKGEVSGLYKSVIEKANLSGLPILSIDIPSGIDGTSGAMGSTVIKATETLFLGLPKSGCFLGKAYEQVGKITIVDFGLESEYIEQARANFYLLQPSDFTLPPLLRRRHKYEAGYVVAVGGSTGMPGAPLLSCKAALRTGAGIVRLLHPQGMEGELGSAPTELVRESYLDGDVEKIVVAASRASALLIGPGMGRGDKTAALLAALFQRLEKPAVIDADGLYHLANHWVDLPPHTILTPHRGEMKRLLGQRAEGKEEEAFLEECGRFSTEKKVILILKGAPTFIFQQGEKPYLVARGDPGMATAGSGDVLTGMVAALLASGKEPVEAAALGALIHAIAGERVAAEKGSYGMIASDIIEMVPRVMKEWNAN